MPEPTGGAVIGGAWWYADRSGAPLTDVDGRAFDAGTIIDDWQVCRTGVGGSIAGGTANLLAVGGRPAAASAITGGNILRQVLATQLASGGSIAGGNINLLAVGGRPATASAVTGGAILRQALAQQLTSGGSIAGGNINLLAVAMQSTTGGAVVGGTFGLPPAPTNLMTICYQVQMHRTQFLADNYKTTVRRRY